MLGLPLSSQPVPWRLPDEETIYRDLEILGESADRLQLRRAEIASPGGFNFEGLGALVEQFRELIRDLWYRNRQERAKGDLEIIRQFLELRRDHPDINVPPPRYLQRSRQLIDVTAESVEKLRRLERDGKLVQIPENLDYEPPKSAA